MRKTGRKDAALALLLLAFALWALRRSGGLSTRSAVSAPSAALAPAAPRAQAGGPGARDADTVPALAPPEPPRFGEQSPRGGEGFAPPAPPAAPADRARLAGAAANFQEDAFGAGASFETASAEAWNALDLLASPQKQSDGLESADSGEGVERGGPARRRPAGAAASGTSRQPLSRRALAREERRIEAVWMKYWKESATVRRYERDWFAHADLAQLTADYKRRRDPLAFMRGLAASPNFPRLVVKYARAGVMTALLKDAVKAASPEAKQEAAAAVGRDSELGGFVQGLGRIVPPESTSGRELPGEPAEAARLEPLPRAPGLAPPPHRPAVPRPIP